MKADASATNVLVHNSPCTGAHLEVTFKPEWNSAQRQAAIDKVDFLNSGDMVVTQVNRRGSALADWLKGGNPKVPGSDIDHMRDLQLGGVNELSNLSPLDASVNRSLGRQIQAQINKLGLKPGDQVCSITIRERC